jgi:hypothetical protein
MRVIFVGGSAVVLGYVAFKNPDQVATRLTPAIKDIPQWPVLLGCLFGGFGIALFVRFIMGRKNETFQTVRAWIGVLAVLLLVFETLFQFLIIPGMSEKPELETIKIWEGVLVAAVAAYFGARA